MSEGNGYVTREQLLAPIVRVYKDVEIAGLGKVEIHTITEAERAKVESYNYRKNGSPDVEKMKDTRCRLCVVGTSKPTLSMADVEALRNKDAAIVDALSQAIALHSGGTVGEDAEKKTITPAEG